MIMNHTDTAKLRVMRLAEVCEITGLSRSSIYAKISAETFPRQIKLGEKASGWISEDISDWIEALRTERK